MPRLSDQPDHDVLERRFSPDRRLALDYLPYPDPRTQSEFDTPEAIALRDASTGATLAEFSGWGFITRYEWPEGGGAELELVRGDRLFIAADLKSFRPNSENAPARPIGELQEWLRSLAPPPQALRRPSRLAQAVTLAVILGLLALLGYGISQMNAVQRIPALLRGETTTPTGTEGINAWLVHCRDIGRVMMSLSPEGSLRVPPEIAPAPLRPLDESGRRFGDGRVMIEVDGTDATWWPRGPEGEAVSCPSTFRETR